MKTCSICKQEFVEYGNNPAPFEGEVCCDDCDHRYVIPARLVIDKFSLDSRKLLLKTVAAMAEIGAALLLASAQIKAERGRPDLLDKIASGEK